MYSDEVCKKCLKFMPLNERGFVNVRFIVDGERRLRMCPEVHCKSWESKTKKSRYPWIRRGGHIDKGQVIPWCPHLFEHAISERMPDGQ